MHGYKQNKNKTQFYFYFCWSVRTGLRGANSPDFELSFLYFWFSKIPGNSILLVPGFVLFKSTNMNCVCFGGGASFEPELVLLTVRCTFADGMSQRLLQPSSLISLLAWWCLCCPIITKDIGWNYEVRCSGTLLLQDSPMWTRSPLSCVLFDCTYNLRRDLWRGIHSVPHDVFRVLCSVWHGQASLNQDTCP